MPSFRLEIGFSPSDTGFSNSISKEDWRDIRREKYGSGAIKPCEGCGHTPVNALDLDCHIEECIMGDKDSAVINLLCRACHAIRHFDLAVENGWVALVNSIFSQEKLVEICREGRHALRSEIDAKNIILLKKDIKEYLSDIKSGKQRHSDKIKVVFGKNFDWEPKKVQNSLVQTVNTQV